MTDQEKRELVEAVTRKLLDRLGGDMTWLKEQGIGVTILAFTYEPGAIAYISTSEREGMVRSMKEIVTNFEAGVMTEPRVSDLIERSSVGAGLRNIRENGIDAELEDLDEEQRRKR